MLRRSINPRPRTKLMYRKVTLTVLPISHRNLFSPKVSSSGPDRYVRTLLHVPFHQGHVFPPAKGSDSSTDISIILLIPHSLLSSLVISLNEGARHPSFIAKQKDPSFLIELTAVSQYEIDRQGISAAISRWQERRTESVLNKNEVGTLSNGIHTSRLISRLIDGRVPRIDYATLSHI